ncbi:Golgi-associated plant pathogenesis-related protein 1 [Exaiptasia diaphana]|uniref:SCP domain-containing protein n=1 Tax=Exaiptasia diaphana TaxID=2652724 RepID=A0A913YEL5_EXADI|nr:Golgi-associated plant pathogenesis-related protein 1 [Exaiptasia diaphana]
MAHEAQAYAVTLARTKSMRHSSIRSYGENLAMRQAWGSDVKYTCAQATKDWYDEVKYYSYSRPGFSGKTGHFTQVVWKSTRRLGVGIAKNGGFIIIVARYSPPGNFIGAFRQNVGRPRY